MRPRCDGCDRPLAVCLCPAMPQERISTQRTNIIVMQHPHEARHKLATVPVLAKCMATDCCEVIIGRRYRRGCSEQLDRIAENAEKSEKKMREVLLLFPGPKAVELSALAVEEQFGLSERCDNESEEQQKQITLLIVDATWQHAKEMVTGSMEFLKGFVSQVCLPYDKQREGYGMGETDLTLRKEPYHGFMSTIEAVGRALGMLEPHPHGIYIQNSLLSVLSRMVSLQTSHLHNKQQHH